MKKLFIYLLLFYSIGVNATSTCDKKIKFIDFQSKYITKNVNLIDSYSGEYVKRTFFVYNDGDYFIVEQKKCTMSNYTMNYFFTSQRGGTNYNKITDRYTSILKEITTHEKLVKSKNFNTNLLTSLKNKNFNQNNLQLSHDNENVEYYFSFYKDDNGLPMYENKFSSYISIGGL